MYVLDNSGDFWAKESCLRRIWQAWEAHSWASQGWSCLIASVNEVWVWPARVCTCTSLVHTCTSLVCTKLYSAVLSRQFCEFGLWETILGVLNKNIVVPKHQNTEPFPRNQSCPSTGTSKYVPRTNHVHTSIYKYVPSLPKKFWRYCFVTFDCR